VAVPEKSFSELLNAYLAIESLLESRFVAEDTRKRAYEALQTLNQQLSELMDERQSQAADNAA